MTLPFSLFEIRRSAITPSTDLHAFAPACTLRRTSLSVFPSPHTAPPRYTKLSRCVSFFPSSSMSSSSLWWPMCSTSVFSRLSFSPCLVNKPFHSSIVSCSSCLSFATRARYVCIKEFLHGILHHRLTTDEVQYCYEQQLVKTTTTKPALANSEMMVFNSVKQARNMCSSNPGRHSRSQETPLPLFLSFKFHAITRSRCLVDTLFNLGLCVSYDRVLRLTTSLPTVSASALGCNMYYAHQRCTMDCSQQGQWTTSTTTPVPPQPNIPSTVPGSRLYSILHTHVAAFIVEYL